MELENTCKYAQHYKQIARELEKELEEAQKN